ncbi:MAG: hypothetical protein RLY65_1799, partial [Pseudomonadota bacterium]
VGTPKHDATVDWGRLQTKPYPLAAMQSYPGCADRFAQTTLSEQSKTLIDQSEDVKA